MVRWVTSPGSGLSARLPGYPVATESTFSPLTVAGPRRTCTGFRTSTRVNNVQAATYKVQRAVNLTRFFARCQLLREPGLEFGSCSPVCVTFRPGHGCLVGLKLLVHLGNLSR